MTVFAKICGISAPEALEAALDASADYVGFVHFPPSPRHVPPERAAELAERARGRAGIVLLTVDAEDALLDSLVELVRPDKVQLHGRETPDRVAAIRARYGRPVWKAVAVGAAADLDFGASYASAANRLLFDARPPADAILPGGNGRAFDWDLLASATPGFVLSGGLDAENVGTAIARARPWAVDVSSGVESAPGRKDTRKIAEFVAAVRAASAILAKTALVA